MIRKLKSAAAAVRVRWESIQAAQPRGSKTPLSYEGGVLLALVDGLPEGIVISFDVLEKARELLSHRYDCDVLANDDAECDCGLGETAKFVDALLKETP